MKLSKEEIDSLIVNDILIGNHFKVGYLELYPELSEDIAVGISCMQDYRDTIDWEDQERRNDIAIRISRLLQFYHKIWEISHRT
jgi:spore coat polysaccharide biosynthesis protein SpsF (cytidylyltransferase family)